MSKETVFVSHHFAVGDLPVTTVRRKDSPLDKHYPVERKAVQTGSRCPENVSIGSSARINLTVTHCRPR